ncbi:hypothetical protein [Parvularcula marina]|uniref:hypothetical protein n=1 Tax=Parvularcula marina TaxID=2292771 RepID=UPI003510EEA2
MSRKLPIAETAVQSIQFSLRHVWPAIRLGWPSFIVFLALMIAGFALLLFNIPGFPDAVLALIDEMEARSTLAVSPLDAFISEAEVEAIFEEYVGEVSLLNILPGLLVMMLGGIVFVPMSVLLFRVAAGDTELPKGYFYWRWTGIETRLVFVYICYAIAMIAITAGLYWGTVWIASSILFRGDVTMGWVLYVLPWLFLLLMLWVTLRSLMIIPAAAIEDRFSLGAALGATGGNFFRLIGSLIIVKILVIACILAFWLILFILSLTAGGLGLQFGDGSMAGKILGAVMLVVTLGASLFFMIALNLVSFGWLGGAWAAIRNR